MNACQKSPSKIELLHVSYDPTRELFEAYNQDFIKDWKAKTGVEIEVKQSHGGSAKQARAVIDGLKADILSLALPSDIDQIATQTHELPENWRERLPNHSAPFTSTIVFLVRKGNPKSIHDWGDLIRPSLQVISGNPKTSGGARYNYLAAWAWAQKNHQGSNDSARAYVKELYHHVPVLDGGARGATSTFLQRGQGDVLLTWENEAILALAKEGKDKVEIVYPSVSILAEPVVAWVDKINDKKGSSEIAQAYLNGLYSSKSQELVAKFGYRPSDPTVLNRHRDQFPAIPLVTVADQFGTWTNVIKTHFSDGGEFDRLYSK